MVQSTSTEVTEAQNNFLNSLQRVNDSYIITVILSMSTVAVGVVLAVFLSVLAGLALALVAIILYMLRTRIILSRELGISYRSTSGELNVTSFDAKEKEEIFIPSRLLMLDVCEIEGDAFSSPASKNLRSVHLPATLKVIGKDIFSSCDMLETVYFQGSAKEWDNIDKTTDFEKYNLIFFDASTYEIEKGKRKTAEKVEGEEE